MNQQARNRALRSARLVKVGGAWLAAALLLGSAAGPAVAAARAEDQDSAAEELQSAASRSLASDFGVTRTLTYSGTTTTLSRTAFDAQTGVARIDNRNSPWMRSTGQNEQTYGVRKDVYREYVVHSNNSTVVCRYGGSDAQRRKLLREFGIQGVKFTKYCLDVESKAESDRAAILELTAYLDYVDASWILSSIARPGKGPSDPHGAVTKVTLPDGSSQFTYAAARFKRVIVGANGLVSRVVSDESGYFNSPATQTMRYIYGGDFNIPAPTKGVVFGKRATDLLDLFMTHTQVDSNLALQVNEANKAGNLSITQLRNTVRQVLTTTPLKTTVTASGQKLVVSFRDKYVNRTHTYKVVRKDGQLRYGG